MTLIEFFDENRIENIACALQYAPEQVVLIGHSSKHLAAAAESYNALVRARGIDTEFYYRAVTRNDLSDIVDMLSQTVEQSENCVLELTGGDDLYLVAAGIVAARFGAQVHLSRMNLFEGKIKRMLPKGSVTADLDILLKVEENIRIYGGRLQQPGEHADAQHWVLDKEFCEDVRRIWSVCYRTKKWNNLLSTIALIQSRMGKDLAVSGTLRQIPEVSSDRLQACIELLGELEQAKLIHDLSYEKGKLQFGYKNTQVRRVLTKAGQALELWLAVQMKEMQKDGKPLFSDIRVGALLEWDDKPSALWGGTDVGNEIDVLAMKGALPLFISCKNGKVETEELYKLSLVAERFGGIYAKKALLVRNLDMSVKSAAHFRARAAEMGIALLELEEMGEDKVIDRIQKF